MQPELLHLQFAERRRRLLSDAEFQRARGPRPDLRARRSAMRQNVGFRLVETGLRLALAHPEEMPKLRRPA